MIELRKSILDAVLDGKLGNGLVVTRQEVIKYFPEVSENFTGVILSNSELDAEHSDTYPKFTKRLEIGKYRILPTALAERLAERNGV